MTPTTVVFILCIGLFLLYFGVQTLWRHRFALKWYDHAIFYFCMGLGFFFGNIPPLPPESDSMAPTFRRLDSGLFVPWFTPEIGDIASFSVDPVKRPDIIQPEPITTTDGVVRYERVSHRLTAIDSRGCWWLTGDNVAVAYDATEYGWLCPGEFRYYGVWYPLKDYWLARFLHIDTLPEPSSSL